MLFVVDFLENCIWEKFIFLFIGFLIFRVVYGMCVVGLRFVIFGGRDSVGRKNDIFVLDIGDLIYNIYVFFFLVFFYFLLLDYIFIFYLFFNLVCYWEKKG